MRRAIDRKTPDNHGGSCPALVSIVHPLDSTFTPSVPSWVQLSLAVGEIRGRDDVLQSAHAARRTPE